MTWWIWILLGLALLAIEIIVPGGIIFLFFGASAIVVGILAAAGLEPLWLQAVVFSVMSVVSLLTMRGPILRRMQARSSEADTVDSLIGENLVLTERIAPNGKGKGELRGTSWSVVNLGDSTLSPGDARPVERVDGLTLYVR